MADVPCLKRAACASKRRPVSISAFSTCMAGLVSPVRQRRPRLDPLPRADRAPRRRAPCRGAGGRSRPPLRQRRGPAISASGPMSPFGSSGRFPPMPGSARGRSSHWRWPRPWPASRAALLAGGPSRTPSIAATRSGVGLRAFTEGGLIVDGGRGADFAAAAGHRPPAVPEAWRIVLVLDTSMDGVHGSSEVEAFRDLPRFRGAGGRDLPYRADAGAGRPGVTGGHRRLRAGITQDADSRGRSLRPHQGGRYASAAVAAVLEEAARRGVAGYGQAPGDPRASSWRRRTRMRTASSRPWTGARAFASSWRAGATTGPRSPGRLRLTRVFRLDRASAARLSWGN